MCSYCFPCKKISFSYFYWIIFHFRLPVWQVEVLRTWEAKASFRHSVCATSSPQCRRHRGYGTVPALLGSRNNPDQELWGKKNSKGKKKKRKKRSNVSLILQKWIGKNMLTGVTALLQPLSAVFQNRQSLWQQPKSHLTPCLWDTSPFKDTSLSCIVAGVNPSRCSTDSGCTPTVLQLCGATCNRHFCLLAWRLLSFIDKLVLFCLQIHGTLVTSSDRFCWKVFFPLEWQEGNAGALLLSPNGVSRWIWI